MTRDVPPWAVLYRGYPHFQGSGPLAPPWQGTETRLWTQRPGPGWKLNQPLKESREASHHDLRAQKALLHMGTNSCRDPEPASQVTF